jgi:hypothetical protein
MQPTLYPGLWPQNVSRLAKYALRVIDGDWKITVLYDVGEGLRYLAVEGGSQDLIERLNSIKTTFQDHPGGAFYVNEYRHVLVPVRAPAAETGVRVHYYCAARLNGEFRFEYEGRPLTTRAVQEGIPLNPGARWVGPRPGIPYVLTAGGRDIYYETPALTDAETPSVRPMTTRRVELSKVLGNKGSALKAASPIASLRGDQGGRFYVNEHGAMFTPVAAGDGNGLDYLYCGQVDFGNWFPEPKI